MSPEPTLALVVDELIFLEGHGIQVQVPGGPLVTVKVRLLFPIADYPGLGSLLGDKIKQWPTFFADYRSWFAGPRNATLRKPVQQTHVA